MLNKQDAMFQGVPDSMIINIHDHVIMSRDHRRISRINGARTQQKKVGFDRFSNLAWIDPMYLSTDEWPFVLPIQRILSLCDIDEWVGNVGGCKHGFKVRPVEQCVCIAKLLYLRLDLGIAEISRLTNPAAIRKITEGYIHRERLDKDCDRWILILGDLYSEIYAQWFDSLSSDVLNGMLRNNEKLIIVDERTTSSTKELQLMSCFNVLGEAIHKAAGLVELATRGNMQNLTGKRKNGVG